MKRFIISCFLFFSVISGYSQEHMRLSFIAEPSVNWMRTSNSNAKNGKSILGFDFGINSDYYFAEDERYSFFSGVQITNTGGELSYHSSSSFSFSGTQMPGSTKIKYRIQYLEIPLDLKLKTEQLNGVRYWGLFGLSPMLCINAKGTSNDGTLDKAKITDEVSLFNLAMNVGIGFDYDIGEHNTVSTGLIFQNGLTDVTTSNAFSDRTNINSLKLKIGLIF